MKGFNLFIYSIKQGFGNLKKNRMSTLASIGTVAACLFVFGLFYFVLSNFQNIIQNVENSVGVTVFFEETAKAERIEEIGREIRGREEVDHIEYVSAEMAWERFKKENFEGDSELLASFGEENPLSDSASYEIYLKDIGKQGEFADYLETIDGIRNVKKSDEVVSGLVNTNKLISMVSLVLILVLLLVSVFLIHSTIALGISIRRPEIAIMRLMGAADFFIWAPFIVEGIVIGLSGVVLPILVLGIAYGRIITYVSNHLPLFSQGIVFLSTAEVLVVLVPLSFIVAVGIGFLGSYITVRRNLNI